MGNLAEEDLRIWKKKTAESGWDNLEEEDLRIWKKNLEAKLTLVEKTKGEDRRIRNREDRRRLPVISATPTSLSF